MSQLIGVFELAMALNESNRSRVQVLLAPNGVQENNIKFELTKADLEVYAGQINRDGLKDDGTGGKISIDYDHAAFERGDTRAAGWFVADSAEVVDGDLPELWADVQWTPRAAQEIRDGEFRYISAEFTFKGTEKGVARKAKQLRAATLTNRPFLTDLAPVTLSDKTVRELVEAAALWDANDGMNERQRRLHAALNPGPPDAARFWVVEIAPEKALIEESGDERHTFLIRYTVAADGDVTPAPESEWVEARQEWVAAAIEALKHNGATRPFSRVRKDEEMELTVLAKQLGLPEDADEDAVNAKLAELNETASKVPNLETQLQELKDKGEPAGDPRVKQLETDLATERTKRLVQERETIIASGERSGRLLPVERESLVKAFGADEPGEMQVSALKELIESRPEKTFDEKGSGAPAPTDETDEKVEAAKSEYEQKTAPGKPPITADEDELKSHVTAVSILSAEGKPEGKFSQDEYFEALARAERGEKAPVPAAATS